MNIQALLSRFVVGIALSVAVWAMVRAAPMSKSRIPVPDLVAIPLFLPGYVVAGLLWGGMDNVGSKASQFVMVLVNAIVYAIVLYLVHRVVSAFRRAKAVR